MKKNATITALLTIAVIAGVPALAITKAAPTLDLPQPETAIQTDIEEVTGKPVVAQGLSMQEAKEIAAAGKAATQEQAKQRAEWLSSLEKQAKEEGKDEKKAEDKAKGEEQTTEDKQDSKDRGAADTQDTQTNTSAQQQPKPEPQNQSQGQNQSQPQKQNTPAAQPSKPAQHTHSWVEKTEKVWVSKPEQKWVVDQAAWDEEISKTRFTMSDGYVTYDLQDSLRYEEQALLKDGVGVSVSMRTITETVHHEEVGHWETVDNGYYENKVVGYVCSGCGATK